jgi:hypothetical protein
VAPFKDQPPPFGRERSRSVSKVEIETAILLLRREYRETLLVERGSRPTPEMMARRREIRTEIRGLRKQLADLAIERRQLRERLGGLVKRRP